MTQLEQTISLPQVLLLCVAQQAPDGSLRLITQAVEEVLEDGFVPALVNAYAAFLDRLAREDSPWVERTASAGPPTGQAAWPPVPAATAAQDRVLRDAASWTPVEAEMAALWEAVLARRPESGSDDFYDLGGDSLRLARLLGRIRAHFQTTAPLHDLLDVPTLEGMARAVQEAIASAGARSLWSPISSFLHRLKGHLRWRLQGSQT